jgi:signal transduction histidine kinase
MAASILLALLLARSVSRPLNEVTAAADRIASGDYSYRIKSQEVGKAGKLARSFNHMAEEVEAARQRLRHFVADVSHELKSPLTAIQGFAQALRDGTAADERSRQNAARIIDEESRRLRRQVDELLQLSRLQSGQFKMNAGRLDLYAVLKQSADLFALSAADKHIELKLSASAGLWVKGDADRLEQVFNNLLDNAVKNSPVETRITVTALNYGNAIKVSVADSGPGLTPDQLAHVFERFYQVTGVRTGVGLGLAISREIVLAHGGSIEARSSPGEGAEFVIFLPAAYLTTTF